MKKLTTLVAMFMLVAGAVCLSPLQAEALNYSDLTSIFESQLRPFGQAVIDGQPVSYFVEPTSDIRTIYVGETLIYQAPHDKDAEIAALASYFGLLTSAGSIASPESAAGATSRLVFDHLVLPKALPKSEMQRIADQKKQGKVRVFGARIYGEQVDINDGDEEGDIYGVNLGLAMDVDNVTAGIIVPYDKLDFDSFEADRVGAILFGQYHIEMSEALMASLTANVNYMYTDLDFDGGGGDSLNTVGGGLSAGLQYLQESYELGLGVSYQYNEDDVDVDDDHQHLIKAGANLGVYLAPQHVVNVFGIYNNDVTDYDFDLEDDDYFDVGLEYRGDLTGTWSLQAGYKKILDLDDYDSDMIYIGSTWLF